MGVESMGGEAVRTVETVGKGEWEEALLPPPLVGVESIGGEGVGRGEVDREGEALELGVATRPGEAVFPPTAGDGEEVPVPPPPPPPPATADVPVGRIFEAEGEGERAGERDTEVEMRGRGTPLERRWWSCTHCPLMWCHSQCLTL